ncbi:MAG TPA: threonine/serine exporter family protein [Patescibacteria group bacterium]|jgi:uncharacterized membrane protein YjjP (DUF1212 family)|nr:threonine/serine exporter family protein [Patescibacteria group bacterium]
METLRTIKHLFRVAFNAPPETIEIEKFGETLSPNVRALRLSVNIADVLVTSGVPVSDVVSMALDVTDRYCQRRVQFDISSTVVMASQDRGDEREPLTLIRHAKLRTPNNMLIQSIQELARDIHQGRLSLDDAEVKFDELMAHPQKYPYWLTTLGSALISAGVGIMFGASPIIIAIMFILGAFVSYILRLLMHYRVPSFFAQVISAILITLIAALVTLAGTAGITIFTGVNPTLIVIGGIVMLVAGLAIVGAVQDAIDEYYITANARLLRVAMMTAGIVAGVLIGLYIAKQFGIYIAVDSGPPLARGDRQFSGAVIVSIGYALSMQSRLPSVIVSGAIGGLGWLTYMFSVHNWSVTAVVASAIAATVIGFIGTILARFWRTPSSSLIMAGIVPLVPGLTLYNALLQMVEGTKFDNPDAGSTLLLNALLIALAIASGASFGTFIGRPMRRTLVRARNALPRQRLHR